MGAVNFPVRIAQAKQQGDCHFSRGKESDIFAEGAGLEWCLGLEEGVDLSCVEVIRELSNYIDHDVNPQLREAILAHLSGCSRCTAVYNGLRNTITLTGDGQAFDLPAGFSERLRSKLEKE